MRVLRSLNDWPAALPGVVLTVGNFDGIHRGHQRILARVVEEARARRGTAVALTFDPHPARLLSPRTAPPQLTTLEQKLALLEALGLDLVLVLPFTRALSQLSPRGFVEEILHQCLRTRLVCVGKNFRFGHQHAGDVALLERLAREFGFALKIVPPVVVRGQVASSSLIRRLVSEGEVTRAARLLGRPFAVTGNLQRGAGRGQKLRFPTLNVFPEQECLPARGVYCTQTVFNGRAYPAATNVGVRPTFDGGPLVVESHLLDFSRRVDRGRLELRFLKRLRREKTFPGPEALRRQIARDVARTRRFFARRVRPARSASSASSAPLR